MKGRLIERLAAVVCALCLAGGVMSSVVFARNEEPAEADTQEASMEPEAAPEATFVILDTAVEETAAPLAEATDSRTTVPLFVDGTQLGVCRVLGGVLYMEPADFCRAAGLNVAGEDGGGVCRVSGEGISFEAEAGALYFICNGRYIYVEGGIPEQGNRILLPVEMLAKCLGVSAAWDRASWNVALRTDALSPLESGDTYYDENDVYWLSRVIYAEAGNQSLLGQIAVGSVVMNRIADDSFADQNTVYDVIFAKNQFDVVINGMIYMEPDSTAVIAAKLALEDTDVAGGATYFGTYDFGDGYDCVMWIGDYCFMTEA